MDDKVCYFCKHFWMNQAEPDLSDVTPGCDWGMSCRKAVWFFSAWDDTEEKFAKCLETAKTCKFFEERNK